MGWSEHSSKQAQNDNSNVRDLVFSEISVPVLEVAQQKQILKYCGTNLLQVQTEQRTPVSEVSFGRLDAISSKEHNSSLLWFDGEVWVYPSEL